MYTILLPEYIKGVLVNSNFENDIGGFTLNFTCNFEM